MDGRKVVSELGAGEDKVNMSATLWRSVSPRREVLEHSVPSLLTAQAVSDRCPARF